MTRDRQAAMDRAVAAYRRFIKVRASNTAVEMIADLIEWHKLYVDKEVDVTALLETATRRAEVAEAGRESISRTDAEQGEEPLMAPEQMQVNSDRLSRILQGEEPPMEGNFYQPNATNTGWSRSALGGSTPPRSEEVDDGPEF